MLKGGWWWKSCGRGLNGLYLNDPQDLTARQGIVWFRWRGWDYTLKKAVMMIKPRGIIGTTTKEKLCPRHLTLKEIIIRCKLKTKLYDVNPQVNYTDQEANANNDDSANRILKKTVVDGSTIFDYCDADTEVGKRAPERITMRLLPLTALVKALYKFWTLTPFNTKVIATSDKGCRGLELCLPTQAHSLEGPEVSTEELDRIIDDGVTNFELSLYALEEKKFKELTIDLDFKVPLSHTVEKSFTHSLSNIDREKFQDLGITLKTGRYNPEEDAILKENWDYFSTEYGFDDPVLFLPGVTNLLSTKQRKKFVQLLGKGLGHRSLNSIYLRFATLYTPQDENRNYRFTSYENKLILRCIEREIAMPFVILSKLIGKERHAISKHYKILKTNKLYKESQLGKWNYDSMKLLIETLLTVSGENDVEKLRKPIPSTVWDSVGTRINIHPSKCKSYWNNKLSTQLFARDPVHFNEVCVKLVTRFYNVYKFKYWVDVKWTDIALDFDGIGPLFLWRRFRHLVRANVPVMMWQNLKGCVKFLFRHTLPKIMQRKKDHCLTRFRYIDNELMILDDK
uniref:Fibrinogen C-terminal domain-containing protein n=1 Tax=Timema poppense TaxID=170557 RepID=A0A7R9D7W8_TIMPO|nr:unnamed protein product [Timema poppensis]